MSRLTIIVGIIVCLAVAAGCSKSTSSSTATSTVFSNLSGFTTIPSASGDLLGGAVQKGPFAAKLDNYSTVSSPAFTFKNLTSQFSGPIDVTTDKTNHFAVNRLSHGIVKIDPAGLVIPFAGTGSAGFNNISSPVSARTALFNSPTAITTDATGTVFYVADSANHAIRKIGAGMVSVLAGTGLAGNEDTNTSLGVRARFNNPIGVTVVGTKVFVVDSNNHTIRMIDTAVNPVVVTTLAGSPGVSGSADGHIKDKDARFRQPARIATDGENLYVTDFGNRTVRRISLKTGEVTTIAGRVGVSGTTDGVNGSSLFRQPNGIATDGVNLYVTDFPASVDLANPFEGTIRRIELQSGTYKTTTIRTDLRLRTPVGLTTNGAGLFVADSVANTIVRIK